MSVIESNKAVVNNFFQALNSGDAEGVASAYSDSGCVQTMGNTLISGLRESKEIGTAVQRIREVFPKGLTFTLGDMVAEGDKVAVEAVSEGEHVSGQTYCNEHHFLFHLSDGKVQKLKEYMDTEQVTDVLCGGQRPPFCS